MRAADGWPRRLGIVVGLEAEARIARRLTAPELVAVSGATAEGAQRAAAALRARGVDALMSFGLAAGLDPGLRAGTLLVPARVRVGEVEHAVDPVLRRRLPGAETGVLLHSDSLVTEPAAKAALFAGTGCAALDMESGTVAAEAAAAGLRLLVLRAVCDPAERSLPPAAALPLGPGGRVSGWRVAGSVLRRPGQVPGLLRLGRDAGRGMRALREAVERVGGGGRRDAEIGPADLG